MSQKSMQLRSGKRIYSPIRSQQNTDDACGSAREGSVSPPAKRPAHELGFGLGRRYRNANPVEEAFADALDSIDSPGLQGSTYERIMECAPEIVEMVSRGEMLRLLPPHFMVNVLQHVPLHDRLQSMETISGGREDPERRTHAQLNFQSSVKESYADVTDIQQLPGRSSDLEAALRSETNISALLDRFPKLTRFLKFRPLAGAFVEQKDFLRGWRPRVAIKMSGLRRIIKAQRRSGVLLERVMIDYDPCLCSTYAVPSSRTLHGVLESKQLEFLALRFKAKDVARCVEKESVYTKRICVQNLYVCLKTISVENILDEDADVDPMIFTDGIANLLNLMRKLFWILRRMIVVEKIESFRLEITESMDAELAIIEFPEISDWESLTDFRILRPQNVDRSRLRVTKPKSFPASLTTFMCHIQLDSSAQDDLSNLRRLKHIAITLPRGQPVIGDLILLYKFLVNNATTLTDLTCYGLESLGAPQDVIPHLPGDGGNPLALMSKLEYVHLEFCSLDLVSFAVALIPATVRKIILTFEKPQEDEDEEIPLAVTEGQRESMLGFMESIDRFQETLEAFALSGRVLDAMDFGDILDFLRRRMEVCKTRKRKKLPILRFYMEEAVTIRGLFGGALPKNVEKEARVEFREEKELHCKRLVL